MTVRDSNAFFANFRDIGEEKQFKGSQIVRCIFSRDINLANKDSASNDHRNGDDREIDPGKINTLDTNKLSVQDITP